MLLKKSLVLLLLLSCWACQEEDNIRLVTPDPIYLQDTTGDGPCLFVPCNRGRYDRYRFHHDLHARKGMWVNVRQSANTVDTIVFHNDSTYSRYWPGAGAYEHKYEIRYTYIYFYGNPQTNGVLAEPGRVRAIYYDTTGVLMLERGVNTFPQHDFYLRIQ